jgi:AAA+ ATPase superfamily predicted ATPase
MKNFIGRTNELATLEREYKRKNGFVVIYGRRRVGKTTLIREFIKDKKVMYFLATEELEQGNMQSFVDGLARFTGQSYLSDAKFNSWEKLFEIYINYEPNEKKILVIDEFQYLINVNSAFTSIFQRVWDTILQDNNVMVILCGSLVSMMKTHVLSYSSPLYGRRTAQIRLAPLRFLEIYDGNDFEKSVKRYAVTGGVPKYIELFDELPLIENIQNEILSKDGFLYEEPTFLLEKEVKETVSYFSIIKAIANGNHKLGQISGVLEMKGTQITPYLKTLIELGILEKQVPITEEFPEKSRKGLYFIKDNFIDFWFKFVAPYKGELEIGNVGLALEKLNKNFIDTHVSYVFEEVSKEILMNLCNYKKIPYHFSKIGSFWDGGTQIDVCSIDNENKICLLGECKFYENPVPADVYFDLLEKVKGKKEFKDYNLIYAIFSKSGFEPRLLELAQGNDKLILIDKTEVVIPIDNCTRG